MSLYRHWHSAWLVSFSQPQRRWIFFPRDLKKSGHRVPWIGGKINDSICRTSTQWPSVWIRPFCPYMLRGAVGGASAGDCLLRTEIIDFPTSTTGSLDCLDCFIASLNRVSCICRLAGTLEEDHLRLRKWHTSGLILDRVWRIGSLLRGTYDHKQLVDVVYGSMDVFLDLRGEKGLIMC